MLAQLYVRISLTYPLKELQEVQYLEYCTKNLLLQCNVDKLVEQSLATNDCLETIGSLFPISLETWKVDIMSKSADDLRVASVTSTAPVLETHGYKVGKVIGQGSYAVVKEAYSSHHKCTVAVKIISKKKAPNDYLTRFLPREMKIVKLLKHHNLILFLQSIETNSRVYIIMEHAVGGDLLDTVRARRVINEDQAATWFRQMVNGVLYCHSQGVVHRDLKCENILLDENQDVKITDFGFARADMGPLKNGEFKLSSTFCGSYAYAAPEILTGTPYVPQLADLWSLGVILYIMVCGRFPFDDSNHKQLLKQVKAGPEFQRNTASTDCQDLIKNILTRAENRLTGEKALKHRWLKKNGRSATTNFFGKILRQKANSAK